MARKPTPPHPAPAPDLGETVRMIRLRYPVCQPPPHPAPDLGETARLIRKYASSVCDIPECFSDAVGSLITAVSWMEGETYSEAICHVGRALVCLHNGLSDPAHRIGGEHCNPALTEIARRLGWPP